MVAPGRFCELFDLSRWCSVVRRPGPLGGWASANYVFRPTWVSRHTRSRRVERANSNGANRAIESTRPIRRVAAKPSLIRLLLVVRRNVSRHLVGSIAQQVVNGAACTDWCAP